MSPWKQNQQSDKKFNERILHLRRVSKKTTGGNYISFSALVVVGDGKGKVGLGLGRGLEVPPAIQKGITQAKKNMIQLPIYKDTIPHKILIKYKASRLLLKPAPPGTGLKVGGVVRVILDVAGVNNASGKIIGTRNQITNAYAVMEAIKRMKPRIVAEKKLDKPQENPVEEKKVAPVVEKVIEEKQEVTPKKKVSAKGGSSNGRKKVAKKS